MQRAKERTVRKYKRRFLAESEAGLDTGTSAVRLKAARQDLKQFIRETGSKEDSARISVAWLWPQRSRQGHLGGEESLYKSRHRCYT